MKRIMIWLASAMILTTLLAGCAVSEPSPSASEQQDEIEEIEIDTAYGTLYYPKQWEAFVKTEQKEDNDTIVVSFIATIQDTSYPLFEVTIGGTEGSAAGELTDAEGIRRTVYMRVFELEEDSSLTEGEQNRLYAMQEDLNYLIDHLE